MEDQLNTFDSKFSIQRMKPIIDLYKNVVIQIATPFSVGTGFFFVNII